MRRHLLFFGLFIIIFVLVFKSLIINISANLIDWRDYAYLTWVVNENINHLKVLDFQNLFNLNAFYPYTNTIFLSDTMIGQALIGLPFSFFTNNPVLIFNSIFFITFLLNYISAYLLFNKIFKNSVLSFVGSLAMIFSPFFFTELGHFQMQNYWPLLLILYRLFDTEKKFPINEILTGILVAIQFLLSVYLAFFGLASIFIFYLVKIYKNQNYKITVSKFVFIIATFLVFDVVFIKGYIDARNYFGIKRNLGEYITYSAKISDYFFPGQTGIFYQNTVVKKWQSLKLHPFGEPAIFPGFALTTLAIIGLVRVKKSRKDFSLHFSTEVIDLFFLILMLVGFSFSLGYPYLPFVKYLPLFDTIRGTSRWSFLLYTGIVYFAVSFLKRIKTKWILLVVLLLFFIDVLPAPVSTPKDSYVNKNDQVLNNICKNSKIVVLEIPVTHFDSGTNIVEGLTYITKRLLATTYNHCTLVNGYSGYDLPSIQNIKNDLVTASQTGNSNNFIKTIKESGANYISVNEDAIPAGTYSMLNKVLSGLVNSRKIQNVGGAVYRVN